MSPSAAFFAALMRSGDCIDRVSRSPESQALASPTALSGTWRKATPIAAAAPASVVGLAVTGRSRERFASSGTQTSLQTSRLACAFIVTRAPGFVSSDTRICEGSTTVSE